MAHTIATPTLSTGIMIAKTKKSRPRRNPAAITSNTHILSGTPTIAGSRLPAASLLDYLSEGYTIQEFVNDYEVVSVDDCKAVLYELREALNDGLAVRKEK